VSYSEQDMEVEGNYYLKEEKEWRAGGKIRNGLYVP
jgi:hypothetical protein